MFMPMIMYPYYNFDISFVDFLLIFGVEIIFFIFMNNKLKIKQNIEIILLACLLKVGLLSLFLNWIPPTNISDSNMVIIFSVLLLLSSSILETTIFQRELLLSKNDAFDLAFKLSVLSTSVFFMFKMLMVPDYPIYYTQFTNAGTYNNSLSTSVTSGIIQTLFLGGISSGLLFLMLGIGLFLYLGKNKANENTIKN